METPLGPREAATSVPAHGNGAPHLVRFGAFELDVSTGQLTHQGRRVPLQDQPARLLGLLVSKPGEIVTREELCRALWSEDTFVAFETALSTAVLKVRQALGDSASAPRFIETVPKRGYRFLADVRTSAEPADVATAHRSEVSAQKQQLPGFIDVGATALANVSSGGSRRAWLAGVFVVAILGLATYLVLFTRSPNPSHDSPEVIATPLTAYQGRETVPSLSPDGSQVAFSWDGPTQDNHDIYVKLVGSGEPLRLTTDRARDDQAAWSPDGAQIAFLRFPTETSVDVMVVPALGGAERRVATGIRHRQISPRGRAMSNLAWTRDGKWLAVGGQPSPTEPGGIWLLEVGGQRRRPLTAAPEQRRGAAGDISPAFSPDGRWMAFIRESTISSNAIYVLRLSADWRPAGTPVKVGGHARRGAVGLAWTPDSRGLIFSSGGHLGQSRIHRIALTPAIAAPAGPAQLLPFGEQANAISIAATGRMVYSAQFRDTTFRRLNLAQPAAGADDPGFAGSTFDEHTPHYSPAGTHLAFASTRSGAEEIWISNADGSNSRQMTFMEGPQCANPQWSPDGRTILFNSRVAGSADLYLLDPATGELTQLTSDPEDEVEARWSRDGQWIYFGSDRTGRFEIWKMPAGGGTATQVTRGGGLAATESPDGFLYYAKDLERPTAIWRVPRSGGEEAPIADGLTYTLNFAVGDRGLYFVAVGHAPDQASIDFLEYSTGRRTTLATIAKPWWAGVALSPDQQWLLYSAIESAGSNLMLVDKLQRQAVGREQRDP